MKETVRIYKERIICREKESKANTSDPVSIAIAFALIVMFLTWNYVLHSETILSGLFILLLTIVCFFLTISVLSLIKGQFTDRSWWNSTVFPMLLLCSCFYLLFCAKAAIAPDIIKLAQTMSVTDFYLQGLTEYDRYYLIFQLIGVTLLMILILINSLNELYYLALMNQRSNGFFNNLWKVITRVTWRFSKNIQITSAFLWFGSFCLIQGYAANWISKLES